MRIGFMLAFALLAGCGKSGGSDSSQGAAAAPPTTTTTTTTTPTTAPASGEDPVVAAKKIFVQRCVPCHGTTGSGDGPASATLDPKPRAFHDAEWQASITDDHIVKIVKFGGAAVGKSPAMPNNPDLSDPAVLGAIKDLVRSFNTK